VLAVRALVGHADFLRRRNKISSKLELRAVGNDLHAILLYLPCNTRTEDRIDKRFIRMNERIRAREVRVIGDEGQQIGIMPPFEALKMAREKNLDLVEISPTAQPPVCRIMDYGKFLYQQEKREREAKKHQKTITVKEVKFRINVDDHDYETKKNHVLRFLDEGDKVKATIFFRGREMTRQTLGRQILERLIKDVENKGVVEFRARQEGNTLHLILAPMKKEAGGKEKPAAKAAPKPMPSTQGGMPPAQGGAQTA
jgi:translation initiation factor IF-3